MTTVCPICGVIPDNELLHAAWHIELNGRLVLLEAHSENLIERVYAIEEADTDTWVNPVTGHSGDCGCTSCYLSQNQ